MALVDSDPILVDRYRVAVPKNIKPTWIQQMVDADLSFTCRQCRWSMDTVYSRMAPQRQSVKVNNPTLNPIVKLLIDCHLSGSSLADEFSFR